MTLDLDRRRAERDEKPHKVILDGDEWELPSRLPVVVIEDLARGNLRSVVSTLFGAVPGEAERAKHDDSARGRAAQGRVVDGIIDRLAPLVDQEMLEAILDELYELGDKKPKKKQPKDHLPPSS